jgi:hypothetical protein
MKNLGVIRTKSELSPYIAAILTGFSFMINLVAALQLGMDRVAPEVAGVGDIGISIAISNLKWNLNGYVAYKQIFNTLLLNGMDGINWVTANYSREPGVLNYAIQKAIALEDPTSSGLQYIAYYEPGIADYYKLSFLLFGYKIESFFYLYFLILFISTLVYFFQFKKQPIAIAILNIYLLSHLSILLLIPSIGGDQLWALHSSRGITVLCILPILHILFLTLYSSKQKPHYSTLLGATIQIVLFLFVLRIRFSGNWLLLFLVSVCVVSIGFQYIKERRRINPMLLTARLWPMMLVILAVLTMKAIAPFTLDPGYFTGSGLPRYPFWHGIYLGFGYSTHLSEQLREGIRSCQEDCYEKYGMKPDDAFNDAFGAQAVYNQLQKSGIPVKTVFETHPDGKIASVHNWRSYEKVMSGVVLGTIEKYPFVVLKSILKRPKNILIYYFYDPKNTSFVFSSISISILACLLFISYRASTREAFKVLFLLGTTTLFSFIPIMLAEIRPHAMSDAFLMITMCVYQAIFMLLLGFIALIRRLYKIQAKR